MERCSSLRSGQSLIEVVIGIAIGVLFITGALGIIMLAIRLDFENKFSQSASELAQSLTEQVASLANSDWHNLDLISHGANTRYRVATTSDFLMILAGSATTTVNGQDYAVFFTIEDTGRDANNKIATEGIVTLDPSTLKINAFVQWTVSGDTGQVVFTSYLTRNRNRQMAQTDWSSGPIGEKGFSPDSTAFATSTNLRFDVPGEISINDLATSSPGGPYSNIDPVFKYAWNDVIGWIDFKATDTVYVTSTGLSGYASSAVGYIALDCETVPGSPPGVCGASNFGVSHNGVGTLGGYGWNDMIGWIKFAETSTPPLYGVTIDGAGDFHGWAWSDTVGWISFNCLEAGSCANAYKVKTGAANPAQATVTSLIYDTGRVPAGAALNAIVWQGSQPTGTVVRFQIASSDSPDGPWNFIGPDGSSVTYYQAGPDTSIVIPRANHNNDIYIRYKAFLLSDPDQLVTPTIRDIAINWSL